MEYSLRKLTVVQSRNYLLIHYRVHISLPAEYPKQMNPAYIFALKDVVQYCPISCSQNMKWHLAIKFSDQYFMLISDLCCVCSMHCQPASTSKHSNN
jgi:hypothetical protein